MLLKNYNTYKQKMQLGDAFLQLKNVLRFRNKQIKSFISLRFDYIQSKLIIVPCVSTKVSMLVALRSNHYYFELRFI